MVPPVTQAAPRQMPATQAPSQQPSDAVQVPPGCAHCALRQRLPTHIEPEQHSLVAEQLRPGAVQLPLPIAQRPLTHCFEQQCEELEQSSPPTVHVHWLFLHWPSQQSEWKRQSAPLDLHGSRHWPLSHEPSQHSLDAEQGCRSAVHIGIGCTVGLQALAVISRRTRMRDTLPHPSPLPEGEGSTPDRAHG